MPIARDNGIEFERPALGMQPAILAFIEDVGTQKKTFEGHDKWMPQLIFFWELTEKMKEGPMAGQPFLVHEFVTNSLAPQAGLRKMLKEWWPDARITKEQMKQGIELNNFLGHPCLLNIVRMTEDPDDTRVKIGNHLPSQDRALHPQQVVRPCAPEWVAQKIRVKSKEALIAAGQWIDPQAAAAPGAWDPPTTATTPPPASVAGGAPQSTQLPPTQQQTTQHPDAPPPPTAEQQSMGFPSAPASQPAGGYQADNGPIVEDDLPF